MKRRNYKRLISPSRREINDSHRYIAALISDPVKRAEYESKYVKDLAPKRERVKHERPTEHQEQVAVIQWWHLACNSYGLPPYSLLAIPNGGARDPITGSRLKAEGVRSGAPDLMLAWPTARHSGLFIEMKRPGSSPSAVSAEQRDFLAFLERAGYSAGVHTSADSAIKAIKEYLT